ncbi:MAG TPA: hypothetical protein PKD64_18790 [Pirellulaceae bacterium]|nr:hypothetical protein [Pirellulaceae bacterium]HMO94238.1 hypothetical protein [Pirellulaceae bacterium]HMP70807.1 hypothetical protein [Pirellulaceae bacterium]
MKYGLAKRYAKSHQSRTCLMGADRSRLLTEVDEAETEFTLAPGQFATVSEESSNYLFQWHELVSRTNWEKGKIICEWRNSVCRAHPEVKAVSDRAWSELIGGITAEHVGRLRRTFERFGEVYQKYNGLRWTHFMVAVSWPDAEMWLEGASQADWTVEQMRSRRWETMGGLASERPDDKDIIAEEIPSADAEMPIESNAFQQYSGDAISGPILEGPDWGDSDIANTGAARNANDAIEKILQRVPHELANAIESLSTLIRTYHDRKWSGVNRSDALKLLNYLKDLVRNES